MHRTIRAFLPAMLAKGKGAIVNVASGASSIRGIPNRYVYGASKAGLAAFLSGLRNRLARSGVRVITVKPGLVDTPMTGHLSKNRLYTSPERVARVVIRAVDGRSDVVYTPWWWRWMMLVLRLIPEPVFKRLSL